MEQPGPTRRVLLGVTAGIAAYKAAELARLLIKAGNEVRVAMTPSATEFIGPMTLHAITGEVVRHELFDPAHEAAMGHIELARWPDRVLVAPASADFLARIAAGMADDLLATLCLATRAPITVAPAMNQAMWRHPATQANLDLLQSRGVRVVGPDQGEQACGDVGPGRMLPPEAIVDQLDHGEDDSLAGRCVVVTAGPTREALDPVRFLGNRSSGKMGFAIARALVARGARVTLVTGPVTLATPSGVERVDVENARQMHEAVLAAVGGADIFVACAAVADYRPVEIAARKIKKESAATLTLELIANPDILGEVSALEARPFCVGFAAETNDVEANAERKRQAKGLDMIAANQVGASQGFDTDDNALIVIWQDGRKALPTQSKQRLAAELVDLIVERFDAQTATEDHR